jgi:hypothetical protein
LATWNRQLSNLELKLLTANPWQLFRISRKLFNATQYSETARLKFTKSDGTEDNIKALANNSIFFIKSPGVVDNIGAINV